MSNGTLTDAALAAAQSNEEVYTCDICGQDGLTEVEMHSHVLIEHVNSQVSCPFCDLEGTTLEEMNIHINSSHLKKLTPSRDRPSRNIHNAENVTPSLVPVDYQQTLTKKGVLSVASAMHNSDPSRSPWEVKHQVKRAKFLLDVGSSSSAAQRQSTDAQKSPAGLTDKFTCPLCDWSTNVEEEIHKHVNVMHLDASSPTTATTSSNLEDHRAVEPVEHECPLCGIACDMSAELELHVNTEHGDILQSPSDDATPAPVSLSCPVCSLDFHEPQSLQDHVNGHFADKSGTESKFEVRDSLLAQELHVKDEQHAKHARHMQDKQQDTNETGSYKKQAEKALERAVCSGQLTITDFYHNKCLVQGVDEAQSATKDIIGRLREFYQSSASGACNGWLCADADHYASTYADKGWGCGYRNFQMMLSCLAHDVTYEQVLFNGRPVVPSIPKIQRLIEAAWQKGFDRAGCEQLTSKLVDTRKWIGATEIVATLSSLSIRCQLVDFHAPTGKGGIHPRLFEWVKDYFSKGDDFKPPLYLQHQGHSRSIIGVDQMKDGSLHLLLFDPSFSKLQMRPFVQNRIDNTSMRSLRRPLSSLRAKQYQIVAVRGVLDAGQYEQAKMLQSDRIS